MVNGQWSIVNGQWLIVNSAVVSVPTDNQTTIWPLPVSYWLLASVPSPNNQAALDGM